MGSGAHCLVGGVPDLGLEGEQLGPKWLFLGWVGAGVPFAQEILPIKGGWVGGWVGGRWCMCVASLFGEE